MSSRGRDYDRHNSKRYRSRSGAFLEALEDGHLGDALGAVKPGFNPNAGDHHHRHRSSDKKYYHADGRPRHQHRNHDDDKYYRKETRPHQRHRSTHTDLPDYDRRGHRERQLSRSNSGPDLRQAAEAAAVAGLIEAWRARDDRDQTARAATAAIGAGATDALIGRKDGDGKTKRHMVESVAAGLAENRALNGSRR
ncbi:hypothetical protein F4779DRAFT_611386 [Xylariaceae sp. FL0662B]|nr:hypothetical protein F4779DRAFT_611386 [Xylariaceae sp. FL0662B]